MKFLPRLCLNLVEVLALAQILSCFHSLPTHIPSVDEFSRVSWPHHVKVHEGCVQNAIGLLRRRVGAGHPTAIALKKKAAARATSFHFLAIGSPPVLFLPRASTVRIGLTELH